MAPPAGNPRDDAEGDALDDPRNGSRAGDLPAPDPVPGPAPGPTGDIFSRDLLPDDAWTPLTGGSVTEVARRGGVVRRTRGPASDAVHLLLRHAHGRGFHRLPRLLHADGTHEYLRFLPGRAVLRPWPAAARSQAWMAQLGRWLRDYHRAVADFRLPPGVRFAWGTSRPAPGMLPCHGDLAPWNCLLHEDALVAVIDWDLARWGPPLDDLAQLALEAVPLRANLAATLGPDTPRRELEARLAALCRGYGGVPPAAVLRHLPDYLTRVLRDGRRRAEEGRQPFARFAERGQFAEQEADLAYLLRTWPAPA